MPLSRHPLPFDHPEWVFELKYDGFRSLAIIEHGRCQLISRKGHPFNSFTDLRQAITAPSSRTGKTVLDGETVCLDKFGRPQFRDLLFHRAEPWFYAFDLLMRDGKDLRSERLTDRKQELRRLLSGLPESPGCGMPTILNKHGTALFQRVCEMDLEGIVARHALDLTSLIGSEARGSKFGIVAILRCKAAKNCLSANATRSRPRAGIVAS